MGMSASQARLLYLTAQINNLSLKGQNVSDAKTRLAMDTQEIQEKYINALNSTRLNLNTNIFSENGVVNKSEVISLSNLQTAGYMVSNGSNILGYKFEDVDTGKTELIATGEYEDDLTKPIYPKPPNKNTYFASPNTNFPGDIFAMNNLISTLTNSGDMEIKSYILPSDDGSAGKGINAIVIKSQDAFEEIYNLLIKESEEGVTDNALKYNYVLDLAEVDLSKFSNTEIKDFSGIFDANGTLAQNYDDTQALFNDGTAKNVAYPSPAPIGYKKKPVYIEHAIVEHKLVEDPNFSISSRELEEGLRSGALTLVQKASETDSQAINLNGVFFNTINLSTCSMITDDQDEEAITKAEAEFNRDMQEIQIKDKRYDMDQKKIDTQYQAYVTEEESIKTVLKKNVENSYKTFNG